MNPLRWAVGCAAALVALLASCSTYRDDLDRAANHYLANRHGQALALLELLERDIDSLSPAERARYAYFRGMSHFRIEQKKDARYWLGVAAAREKADGGSLFPDEKKRVEDTLAELNKERYGGAATADVVCALDGDCPAGHFCDAGHCKSADEGPKKGDADVAAKNDEPASTEGDAAKKPEKKKKKKKADGESQDK
jgi:hypothetical protein